MNKDDPKFKQIHTYLVKLQVHNISTLEMISSHCEIPKMKSISQLLQWVSSNLRRKKSFLVEPKVIEIVSR